MLHTPLALLTREETSALARRALAGDRDARDTLVMSNKGFAVSLVREIRPRGPISDLCQAAMVGLIKAAERYDPDRLPAATFATYARYWIRLEVLEALDAEHAVHVPDYLTTDAEYWPVNTEGGIKRRARNRDAAARARDPLSRFRSRGDVEGLEHPLCQDPPIGHELEQAAGREEIARALDQLSPTEAVVITARYGLDGEAPQTLRALGRRVGISGEWVRKIEKRALAKLRDLLSPDGCAA
jgi:RNA polymerase primary sigma factor